MKILISLPECIRRHFVVMVTLCLILLVVYPGDAAADGNGKVFYVATDGCDTWSGMLASPDTVAKDGPFATIQRACEVIRSLRKSGARGAFSVMVRGGRYQLTRTIVLGPEDSGTDEHPLVIKAYGTEKPVLSGAVTVSRFNRSSGKILKADLSQLVFSQSVRQLFASGKRQTLARYPNIDKAAPIKGGFLYVEKPSLPGSLQEFIARPGSLRGWADTRDAEIVIFPGDNYTNNILQGFIFDKATGTVTIASKVTHGIKPYNRYYLQNLLEELDAPGEWVYERYKKILYYWPTGESSAENVMIPLLTSLIEVRGHRFNGKLYGTPSNIRVEGLTLEECQSTAVIAAGAKNIIFAGNTIAHTGIYGIEIIDGTYNAAISNEIYDTGHTGIVVSGGDSATISPARNRVENNYIHDTGAIHKGGASGILCKGVGNIVRHNLLHSMPRVGIWVNGNDHLIEYNHAHHVNQETEDSGIIYLSQVDWTKRGTVIRYNYLHDSGGYGRNSATGVWQTSYHTYGVYLDDWTSGTTVYGNIIANTAAAGVLIHGGRDNRIENNIIYNGGNMGQLVYSAIPPDSEGAQMLLPGMFRKISGVHLRKYQELASIHDVRAGATMSGNSFLRNIVSYTGQNVVLYAIYHGFDAATTVSDYNIIHHGGLPLLVPFTKVPPERQWPTWVANNFDRHTVIADPWFVDATHGDFRLAEGSPALKVGFVPIPVIDIGLYKDQYWFQ